MYYLVWIDINHFSWHFIFAPKLKMISISFRINKVKLTRWIIEMLREMPRDASCFERKKKYVSEPFNFQGLIHSNTLNMHTFFSCCCFRVSFLSIFVSRFLSKCLLLLFIKLNETLPDKEWKRARKNWRVGLICEYLSF